MISVIAAVAEGGVIGAAGEMPWHISEDLAMFRRVTMGHPVVMGRRTFEGLGRPLPGRINVVVTRNPDFPAPGVVAVASLEEAVAKFTPDEEIFVIGGGEVYAAAMPLAHRLYITRIEARYNGDVWFPAWDPDEWHVIHRERHPRGKTFENPFEFLVYERK